MGAGVVFRSTGNSKAAASLRSSSQHVRQLTNAANLELSAQPQSSTHSAASSR